MCSVLPEDIDEDIDYSSENIFSSDDSNIDMLYTLASNMTQYKREIDALAKNCNDKISELGDELDALNSSD